VGEVKQRILRRVMTAQRTRMTQTENDEKRQTWVRLPFSTITGEVELHIDIDAVVNYLGQKALLSKGKRARAMSGDIEVCVITRKETKL